MFLAPSLSLSMGWGVFAGRSFEKDEIVDISPLILPMPHSSPQVVNSVLDDYVYGYRRLHFHNQKPPEIEKLLGVFLGMTMFHNHHPSNYNLEYTTFGREPAPDVPNASNAVGFRARRFIQAGEELFSHYGENKETDEWFHVRRIPLRAPEVNQTFPLSQATGYCSKIFSGIGRNTWENRIMPILPPRHVVGFFINSFNRLPPWDAGLGDARAKVDIAKGERIELAIGLVMSQEQLKGSILAPVAIAYQDLTPAHRESLGKLRQLDQLRLQYQGKATDWRRIDSLQRQELSLEDIAIFPAAGNIGMVRRMGPNDERSLTNCQLVIPEIRSNDSAGVVLELIATKSIATGEVLLLDLPNGGTQAERRLLKKELALIGMPFHDGIFAEDETAHYAHPNNDDL